MLTRILNFWRQWKELRRFKALGAELRKIVFYAEDIASYVHFEHIIDHLVGPLEQPVCYLTSAEDDPLLDSSNNRIRAFWIGDATVRTIAFTTLDAVCCVMTMPSIEIFHLKHSRVKNVHYVYVFHSIVSSHMIYRPKAFDHYDTIFCVGPHHVEEIRSAETVDGLPAKHLIKVGYGRLDTLLRDQATHPVSLDTDSMSQRRILVAPSWSPHGLLETRATELVSPLLEAGFHVTVRPHPMTTKKTPDVLRQLHQHFTHHAHFVLETDVTNNDSLQYSHVMISDWSGAALEYAFGFERPVVFIDVPRKVNNPTYESIGCTPIEVSLREQVGELVAPEDLGQLPAVLDDIWGHRDKYASAIRSCRSRYIYNLNMSGRAGAEALVQIVAHAEANDNGTLP